jgi:hypothetical protein
MTYQRIFSEFLGILRDVTPVVLLIGFFQVAVIRKRIPGIQFILIGFGAMVLGLYLFVLGLEMGVFPVGETLARQFSLPQHIQWIYLFAFLLGYSTAVAEPALLAISLKAQEITAGTISSWGLRNAVAFGVGFGILLGVSRIISGGSLVFYILAAYLVTILLTLIAPKYIVALAYDSGGVTTSTVTVPLVAALGIGLATHIEGRNPLIDGFGLVAFAAAFPMVSVLGYSLVLKTWASLRRNLTERKMY